MRTAYIYALKDPYTGKIRYIGKSDNPKKRFPRHLADARDSDCHRANWIKSLATAKLRPTLEIIDEVDDGVAEGLSLEAAYIQFFRDEGCDLTNATPGGDCGPVMTGIKNPMFGRGDKSYWFGRKHSSESIAKMVGRKHSPSPYKGKKRSLETVEKTTLGRRNKKMPSNTSGFCGVYKACDSKKWGAFISYKKRRIHLGTFKNFEDAVFVRRLAEDKYFA